MRGEQAAILRSSSARQVVLVNQAIGTFDSQAVRLGRQLNINNQSVCIDHPINSGQVFLQSVYKYGRAFKLISSGKVINKFFIAAHLVKLVCIFLCFYTVASGQIDLLQENDCKPPINAKTFYLEENFWREGIKDSNQCVRWC